MEIFPRRSVDVKGEILELKNTVNVMVDQLTRFASVTRVAREELRRRTRLGVRQELGVWGTWKDLTGRSQLMATSQPKYEHRENQ